MPELSDTASRDGMAFGSAAYWRASWALFLAGFATFSLIYCVQPLLPTFARAFDVTPAISSLALSFTTGSLAVAIVVSGGFAHLCDRRWLMFGSMFAASCLNITAGLLPGWTHLLAVRMLEGLLLGGVPAVAMAHLADEMDPQHLGRAMGLYVSGTAFGGMSGRVGMGLLSTWFSWRASMILYGLACLASSVGFVVLLPRPRPRHHGRAAHSGLGHELRTFSRLLQNRALVRLFSIGFLLNSAFITVFNYTTFRLAGPPYLLPESAISLIFLAYGFGMLASSFSALLAELWGARALLLGSFATMLAGTACTLFIPLPGLVLGISLVTIGFFAGHSVASGTVGRLALGAKGHAASLYLLFYYTGSSVLGSVGGWFWQAGGWNGVVCLVTTLGVLGIALSGRVAGHSNPETPESC